IFALIAGAIEFFVSGLGALLIALGARLEPRSTTWRRSRTGRSLTGRSRTGRSLTGRSRSGRSRPPLLLVVGLAVKGNGANCLAIAGMMPFLVPGFVAIGFKLLVSCLPPSRAIVSAGRRPGIR